MGLIKKDDLIKLKQSKPVPITAHSGELVVPVVYANTVQKFLKKKNVKLPLTQNQLAAMKKKANKIAVKKQPKAVSVKKAKGTSQQQTVIVNIHKSKRAASSQPPRPSAASHLASIASRLNSFAAIAPYNLGPQMIGAPIDDKAKLAALLKHFEEQIKKPAPQSHTSAKIHDDEKKIENQFKPIVEPTQPIRPVRQSKIIDITDPIQIRKELEAEGFSPRTLRVHDANVKERQDLEEHKKELDNRIKPIVPVAQPIREANVDRIDAPSNLEELRRKRLENLNIYKKKAEERQQPPQQPPPKPPLVLKPDEQPIPKKKYPPGTFPPPKKTHTIIPGRGLVKISELDASHP
jgi:hypothetical protein